MKPILTKTALLIFISIFLMSCQYEYPLPDSDTPATQEELRQALAVKECESPTSYLTEKVTKFEGRYKNAISLKFNGYKIKMSVKNTATAVTFKNVKCKVTLSSNSGYEILSKKFTISEFVPAGKTITYSGEFSCTNQEFKDTDVYSVTILGAECH